MFKFKVRTARCFWIALIAPAFWVSLASADSATAPALIAERLSLMKDVAIYKAKNGRPVEDLEREAVVLDAAVAAAGDHGLEPETTRAFFQAQIDAAKDIQFCWLDKWAATSQQPEGGADLVTELRPELLRLGNAIVEAIAADIANGRSAPNPQSFRDAVAVECLGDESNTAIAKTLSGITLRGE
ncbi:gamma subclass chorismate mutase AroQ [Hoeflea sp. TYP-13]|uniref:gamma subclass chorismate mutase AroQ n=1 Tax=Hoeflea sp. TYP-13 TaxID=3230023 RepID=UPI0034C648C8